MTTAATDTRALDELAINTIRTLSMDAVQKANSGHPGTPMALAPLAYVLYTRVMRHNPGNPDWFDRDRFVLSAGHASMLLYSSLYLAGYGLTLDDLKNFRQLGSPTAGHPEYETRTRRGSRPRPARSARASRWRSASRSAERMLAARFNRAGHELVDHHTFVIASDGDIQEGVASEASSLAGHLGLGKLIVFYDNNHIQLAGDDRRWRSPRTSASATRPTAGTCIDVGEDMALDTLERGGRGGEGGRRPAVADHRALAHRLRLARTSRTRARRTARRSARTRSSSTKEAYGWPTDEDFYVPDEALEHFRERARARRASRGGVGGARRAPTARRTPSCGPSSSW